MKKTGVFVVLVLSIIFFTSTSTVADNAVPAARTIFLESVVDYSPGGRPGFQIPKGTLLIHTWPSTRFSIFFELNVKGCRPRLGTGFYSLYISSPSLGVKRLFNFNTVHSLWTFHSDIVTQFDQAYFDEQLHVWVQREDDNGVDDGITDYSPILVGYSQ